VTGAPILLTDNDNMADVIAYIEANVAAGGTVYALGGTAVVADTLKAVENSGFVFKRLAGSNRFATNLMILEEAGINSGDPVLVCTAYNFADSLSASALGLPILLVDDTVSAAQMDFLRENADGEFILVGGTGAVKPAVEEQLREYWDVVRLAGNNRFQTSVLTAIDAFGYSADSAVLAYGYNFPDGLCAGPLAYALGAPLILTATGDEAAAVEYATSAGITSGFVLGGPTLIDDPVVKSIFSMGAGDSIVLG
jgi:putative cell wall-binding protein